MGMLRTTERGRITIAYPKNGRLIKKHLSKQEVEETYKKREKALKDRKYPRAIEYNFLDDAAYLFLVDPNKFPTGKVKTVTVQNGINCDFYKNQVVGIEILWVTDHIEQWISKYATQTPKRHYNILSADPKARKLKTLRVPLSVKAKKD